MGTILTWSFQADQGSIRNLHLAVHCICVHLSVAINCDLFLFFLFFFLAFNTSRSRAAMKVLPDANHGQIIINGFKYCHGVDNLIRTAILHTLFHFEQAGLQEGPSLAFWEIPPCVNSQCYIFFLKPKTLE